MASESPARSEPREPMTPEQAAAMREAIEAYEYEASVARVAEIRKRLERGSYMPTRSVALMLCYTIADRDRAIAALRRQLDAARLSCAFFASAIKSGEPWTPDAQDLLDQAMGRAATVPSTGAGPETKP